VERARGEEAPSTSYKRPALGCISLIGKATLISSGRSEIFIDHHDLHALDWLDAPTKSQNGPVAVLLSRGLATFHVEKAGVRASLKNPVPRSDQKQAVLPD
jgi:hypothetical protein